MKNSYLPLIKWLLEHTELKEELDSSAEELKQAYLKEADVPEIIANHRNINSKIGTFLYIIYGSSLEKSEDRPIRYNITYSAKPVRTVLIGDIYE